MQQNTRCLFFNIMKMIAVLFANLVIINALYSIFSNPHNVTKIEYAYILLGFVMLLGATFATSDEFCDEGKDKSVENMTEMEIIKEELKKRDDIRNKEIDTPKKGRRR